MTIKEWLKDAKHRLDAAGVATARLDSLILLEDVLGKDRTQLLAHDDLELTREQLDDLDKLIGRRAKHEPLAYIRGKTEFYGREFMVTPDTLEPRPETETMITLLKEIIKDQGCIVDVGTGSGSIAITTKLELPALSVIATEINADALAVAKKNAQAHQADISFYHADLLELLEITEPCIILANLPYVPDQFTIDKAGLKEKDIITKIDGTAIDENNSLTSLLGRKSVGDRVALTVNRGGKEMTIDVTLEAAPAS